MRVNVASMMLMAKYAIPEMIKSGGGSIINLTSVAGLQGGHPSLLYPTSKGAIVSLTRAMAAHHGRDGIRVNCIAPGTVYTPMVASRGMTPEMRKARSERTLLGTEGTGWDIGYGALYLASDESRWVTGITLPIDGGATAGSKGSPVPPSEPAKDSLIPERRMRASRRMPRAPASFETRAARAPQDELARPLRRYFFVPIRGTHLRARAMPVVVSLTPVTSLIWPAGHDPSSTMMRWPSRKSTMSCSRRDLRAARARRARATAARKKRCARTFIRSVTCSGSSGRSGPTLICRPFGCFLV